MSATFHGRDLYAPAAAMIRKNELPGEAITWEDRHGWPDDLNEVVYIDHFGNCMSGIKAGIPADIGTVQVNGISVPFADTFSAVTEGTAFWYRNSQRLAEIAVNSGSAADQLNMEIGTELVICE